MAKPLRPKRGTTAKNDAFTGLASEITIDTEKHSIRVHDGVTAGGHEILPKAKNDELYAPQGDYLPTSGGTMTGSIFFHPTEENMCSTDDGGVTFHGGRGYNHGGYIKAYGKDAPNAPGAVELYASDGTNASALLAWPDGRLVWRGNSVITSAGGQIDGKLVLNNSQPIKASRDDMRVLIAGGTGWDKGAHLILSGKDSTERTAGSFEIIAYDGANEGRLEASPNGTLTWAGKEIERVNSSGNNWIRYESGWQIVWGNGVSEPNGAYTVSYPVAFIEYPSVTANMVGQAGQNNIQLNVEPTYYDEKTSCVFWTYINNQLVGDCGVLWTALGRWK